MLSDMARIAIIGGGSIGEALLSGLLRAGRQAKDLVVAERIEDRAKYLADTYAVLVTSSVTKAADNATFIVVAVKPADVRVPLQGHFANKDDFFTPQAVSAFEDGLKKARKPCEFFRYDADHAFANEQRASVHDRQAAELAWGRAIDFLKKHLG